MIRNLTSLTPAPPSLVNLDEFLKSRCTELASLSHKSLNPVPKIPNNLRRRLKSFRPFRTVHKRRQVLRRAQLASSIPTYRWHAKRFTMKKMWDRKFPWSVNDKGHKSIYRRFVRHSVISDLSYWNCQKFSGNFPSEVSRLLANSDFRLGRCRVIDLVNNIPTIFLILHNILFIYTHPSFSPSYTSSTPHYTCNTLDNTTTPNTLIALDTPYSSNTYNTIDNTSGDKEITWLELRGPKSIESVAKVLEKKFPTHTNINCLIYGDLEISVFRTSQGCDVYIRNSLANDFFRSLIFSGVSAIGYWDRFQLLSEFQVCQVPEDVFPAFYGRLVLDAGAVKAGDVVQLEDGNAGVVVRTAFSLRLGKVAALVKLDRKISQKFPVINKAGVVEPVEWLMADDPSLGIFR